MGFSVEKEIINPSALATNPFIFRIIGIRPFFLNELRLSPVIL
jgi:hypothetical protein